ncbi:MAG: hypothetical protein B7Y96_10745 [Comamonadaceae bacterium 32-67-11]|nr:MAG: hypothetical protein B7Y96_10745 [Comamonadaceae bacterium 32-67-11]
MRRIACSPEARSRSKVATSRPASNAKAPLEPTNTKATTQACRRAPRPSRVWSSPHRGGGIMRTPVISSAPIKTAIGTQGSHK